MSITDNLKSVLIIDDDYNEVNNKHTLRLYDFLINDQKEQVGDVNGSGVTDITDATLIAKYLVDLIEFDDNQKAAADVNGDGVVSISDVTLIQKYIVGLYKF